MYPRILFGFIILNFLCIAIIDAQSGVTIQSVASDAYTISVTLGLQVNYTGISLDCTNAVDSTDFSTFTYPANILNQQSALLTCNSLSPGYVYNLTVTVNVNSQSDIVRESTAKTLLSPASIFVNETVSKTINVEWQSEGYYDSLLIKLTLYSTRSEGYWVNSSIDRPECIVNTVYNYTYDYDGLVDFPGLCPLSSYNVSILTTQVGFNSVESFKLIETKYENADCVQLDLLTLGNKTTFYWPKPSMMVSNYYINIYNESNTRVFSNTSTANQIDVYGLGNEISYTFEIMVGYRNFRSPKCLNKFKTGQPCPAYNEESEIEKLTAPYVDNVSIRIKNDIFKHNASLIDYILVIVSQSANCSSTANKANCYVARNITTDEFYAGTIPGTNESVWGEDGYQKLNLSKDSSCASQKNCNIKFAMDTTYYINLEVHSKCDIFVSNTITINIPSPFPLSTAIAITIGCVAGFLIILLLIILVITFRHVKAKHEEDLARLIENSSSKQKNGHAYANEFQISEPVISNI